MRGSAPARIDDKGRLKVPTMFRAVIQGQQGADVFVTSLSGESVRIYPLAVWIEIEGHTDNVGSKTYNEQLGLERAEAVKRYLYEQHQVPLHKINAISYGEDKPATDNKTRDGRAQNRRVVIKVLA